MTSPKDPRAILPESWLSGPPNAPLPVEYSGTVDDKLEGDAYLAWKAQEYLARTGRLPECDADLVADALMMAAKADGPGAVREALRDIMAILAWPEHMGHRGTLYERLETATEQLVEAMNDSPSVATMFGDKALAAEWRRARHHADVLLGTGPGDGVINADAYPCPWTTLDGVLAAASERAS